MGGKKRPTISQLEKRWRKELESKLRKRGEEEGRFELQLTKEGRVSQASVDAVSREVVKWPYVTPYQVSSRFGVKISTAKRILKRLEEQGVLKLVDANRRVRIYVPAARAT
ncbi:MAG: 30S ribosomal protein S25e [Thermoprotei archaeon]|nr:30S ribosomal protein S25e [Thermoproteales archaeon]RLE89055.1 MAG: 30S ribosomal protein S25e [Thermoprotei archaeon]RLE98254.1 MAG: 30S ribosomal protein S25e [Thermoprotei archaeon]